MTPQQTIAFNNPCYFGFECAQPRYRRIKDKVSMILTINTGYE